MLGVCSNHCENGSISFRMKWNLVIKVLWSYTHAHMLSINGRLQIDFNALSANYHLIDHKRIEWNMDAKMHDICIYVRCCTPVVRVTYRNRFITTQNRETENSLRQYQNQKTIKLQRNEQTHFPYAIRRQAIIISVPQSGAVCDMHCAMLCCAVMNASDLQDDFWVKYVSKFQPLSSSLSSSSAVSIWTFQMEFILVKLSAWTQNLILSFNASSMFICAQWCAVFVYSPFFFLLRLQTTSINHQRGYETVICSVRLLICHRMHSIRMRTYCCTNSLFLMKFFFIQKWLKWKWWGLPRCSWSAEKILCEQNLELFAPLVWRMVSMFNPILTC